MQFLNNYEKMANFLKTVNFINTILSVHLRNRYSIYCLN